MMETHHDYKIKAILHDPKKIRSKISSKKSFIVNTSIPSIVGETYPKYTGPMEIIPIFEDQILETKKKIVMDDITVKEIPVAEVTNPAGGFTITIGI